MEALRNRGLYHRKRDALKERRTTDPESMTADQQQAVLERLDAYVHRHDPELVAVDTSHGRETELLRPVAERLRAAGLPVELVESAPGRVDYEFKDEETRIRAAVKLDKIEEPGNLRALKQLKERSREVFEAVADKVRGRGRQRPEAPRIPATR